MLIKAGDDDTICALSTAPGVGGIAVIRVSGYRALELARKTCRFLPSQADSHRVYYGICRYFASEEALDEVLVAFFSEGRSFTGEETVEISCHGGSVITATLLKELVKSGCRMAKKGEFTYRAFMNGRLDLVQAEAVLGLIESQSRQSAKVALRQLQGRLSKEFEEVETRLLWILAHLEASIDFSTEGLETVAPSQLAAKTSELLGLIATLIGSYENGRRLRDGLQIALIGRPNAGKSSLLNAFLKEDRAIVTAQAGTTRDLVEGQVSLFGVPVTFVDTAGLRETENEVEILGIARSKAAMERADFVFFILDPGQPAWREDYLSYREENRANSYFLFNKSDLNGEGNVSVETRNLVESTGCLGRAYWVSASTGQGLESIEKMLSAHAELLGSESSNVVTQARHLESLEVIRSCLARAIELMREDASPEFIAFELQEAIRASHELLGKEFNEQVIDRIFKEFCLGK